jgi:hypothetical protein
MVIHVERDAVQEGKKPNLRNSREKKLRTGLPDGICIFKPKIQIWVNSGGSCNGRQWCILGTFGQFYSHLVYVGTLWTCVPTFCGNLVYFYPLWYVVPRKIWQPWLRIGQLGMKNETRKNFDLAFLIPVFLVPFRVARFFSVQHTKTGKNDHIIYPNAKKYTKWQQSIPNNRKIDKMAK